MIQEILTGITVSGAILYTFYSFGKTIFASKGNGCGGGCPSCEAKDLLIKDIHNSGIKTRLNGFKPIK